MLFTKTKARETSLDNHVTFIQVIALRLGIIFSRNTDLYNQQLPRPTLQPHTTLLRMNVTQLKAPIAADREQM